MQTSELVEGRTYAFRIQRSGPLERVTLISKVGRRGHIKIRHEEGEHPGLEDYADTRQLVVPWGEVKALLRDEARLQRIRETVTARNSPRQEAISTLLAASGEPSAYCGEWLSMPEDELQRIIDRAGLDESPTGIHSLAYKDRHGEVHMPVDGAERLARAFAAAEAENIVMYIDDQEEELRRRGNVPGDRYLHDLLRQYQPGWALARQWAGFDRAAEELQKEVARLRGLVMRAASELRDAGDEMKSRRLIRALDGR